MTDTTHAVVGVGAAIVDVLARVTDATVQRLELPKGGMTLVDEDRAEAIHEALEQEKTLRSGGSVANTIAALGALGVPTAFIGKRAGDMLGETFALDIRGTGAAFDAPSAKDGRTATCHVLVTPDAERTMATHLGVSGDLGPDEVDEGTVRGGGVLYLEGYLWDKPAAKDAFRAAMAAAKDAGRKVALSLSDPFCVDRHRDSFREIVEGDVDILFANEDEALALYEVNDVEAAASRLADAVEIAAVTRSEKGALVLANGARHEVAAVEVPTLVDTTGAGDLFAAGFLFGLSRGEDAETCGRMGCEAAAAVIQVLGARCPDALRARFRIADWID